MKDTRNRRKRFDPPEPTDKRVIISDRDVEWFRALQTHGTLPSTYLHAFGGGSHKATLHRLTDLYHHGYVTRPSDQRRSDMAKYQPVSYQLGDKGWRVLERKDLLDTYTASFRGHTLHQFMVSCLTASIHLACRHHGFTYISQEDILSDSRCTRKELSLPYNGTIIKPDQLFGIKYADDKVRFFAVEAERADKNMTRYEEKLRPYDAIIEGETHLREWGIPNMRVLVLTATNNRIKRMMEPLKDLNNPGYFLFRFKSQFEEQWLVPPVMMDLLEEPWQTVNGDLWINRPKA